MPRNGFVSDVEIGKALDLLIHDLRAPLSVAHGYLRLLKENRLSSADERARALEQSIEALTKMSRMCADASAYAAPAASDTPAATVVQLSRFVDQVRSACALSCAGQVSVDLVAEGPAHRSPGSSTRSLCARNLTGLAEGLAIILCATKRAAGNRPVTVTVSDVDDAVQFLMGSDEDRVRLRSDASASFDPWRGGHTIALPLACRTVAEAGGRIWTLADIRGAIAVAIPLEDSAS